MLHVTNGDIAVERMRDGGLRGTCLPWRDVLHEGPVPQVDSLEGLSAIRARHLADNDYGEHARIAAQFAERDAMLGRCDAFNEVVLWFEQDPYDELQLLQVLDWLGHYPKPVPVFLILVDDYPGIDDFVGLGQLSPAQLVGLLDSRIPVTPRHFQAATQAWRAYRQPDPRAFASLVEADGDELPGLQAAALRLLEELPSVANGLSRTEQAALDAVRQGIENPVEIFADVRSREQRPWLGDWPFWRQLAALAEGPEPLLQTTSGTPFHHPPRHPAGPAFESQRLRLTPSGREVLENRRDAVKLRSIDRWLGGTHLTNRSAWRWNEQSKGLVSP